MKRQYLFFIFFLLFASSLIAGEDEFNTERLPIGNPKTKYDFCAVKLDKIFDTNAKSEITQEQFIEKLKKYHIIMVGESHTSDPHHKVQLNIIKSLVESGSSVCLALEMFTEKQNETLNAYTSGKITEDEFLEQSNFFNVWGHNYRYYKPIFDYAREKQLRMYGVNIESKYSSKIGRGGISALTPEELKSLPIIDTTDVEHRFYIKAAMQGMDATAPAQFRKIYAAQCLWDAAMGNGAIKTANLEPESKVVVLAGSGHVVYNLGIGKIIKKRSNFSFTSVVCIDVPDTVTESIMMQVKKSIKKEKEQDKQADDKPKQMKTMGMMHGMKESTPHKIVIASLADFLWGVPEEKYEKYPSFGFSVKKKSEKGFEIKRVIPETIAQKHGLKKGDIILSIDDKQFENMGKLKYYLSFKNWHDSISFKILRDDKEMTIEFVIEPEEE